MEGGAKQKEGTELEWPEQGRRRQKGKPGPSVAGLSWKSSGLSEDIILYLVKWGAIEGFNQKVDLI